MKTIFDKGASEELIERINKVDANSKPEWGNMNAYQMVKHCRLWEDMILGTLPTKRVFIGRIFGKMGLKAVTKDDAPLRHSTPTAPELFIKETSGDFFAEKAKWIAHIREHKNFSNTNFVHPFFGPMTKEQIGIMDYKHIDHHLRQFGA